MNPHLYTLIELYPAQLEDASSKLKYHVLGVLLNRDFRLDASLLFLKSVGK
jgi:hypothetical protein